jgi:hypothetical protein
MLIATLYRSFYAWDADRHSAHLGQIKLVVVLTLINSIREYQMILVMTNGGPGWATIVP